MQITIDIPDDIVQNTSLSEEDWMREIAIALFAQERLTLDLASKIARISIDEFYRILVRRKIVEPPTDADDESEQLILGSLRTSLGQVNESKVHPISELWEGIDG
ncbi:MAG: UPF0175 family protein [Cyanobacteriota bacterium]|nr:UPF0175 family protein [Cyanobacteriota bacterium]